jgi:putative ABC transport system substrate-binding protein
MNWRSLLRSCALALPLPATAQTAPPGATPVTAGVLVDFPLPTQESKALRDELARLGWREGANLRLEVRETDTRGERLDAAVSEVLASRPSVLIVSHEGLVGAIRRRNERLPIVMVLARDPVGAGLAASLQRPGGSVTGLVTMQDDIRPKVFELTRQLVPKARRFGAMFFYAGPPNPGLDAVLERGRQLARQVDAEYLPLQVRDASEIEGLVATLRPAADHVLLVNFDPGLGPQYPRIAALARAAKLPSASQSLGYARLGGLMGYGPDLANHLRRAAQLADKVLRGTPPGDIAIEQPTFVKLVLNQRTAREIGLAIPQAVLLRADEVIE